MFNEGTFYSLSMIQLDTLAPSCGWFKLKRSEHYNVNWDLRQGLCVLGLTGEQEGQSTKLLSVGWICKRSSTFIILWFVHCCVITHPDQDLRELQVHDFFLITCEGKKPHFDLQISAPSPINLQENLIRAQLNPHTLSHRGISFFNIHVTVQLSPLRLLSDDLKHLFSPEPPTSLAVSIAWLFCCWCWNRICPFANLNKAKAGHPSQGGAHGLVWVWMLHSQPDTFC